MIKTTKDNQFNKIWTEYLAGIVEEKNRKEEFAKMGARQRLSRVANFIYKSLLLF